MSELRKCYEALDVLAASGTIRKGIDSKLSIKQQRAIAIAKATKTPAGAALARRIMQLEKAEAVGLAYTVPLMKAMESGFEGLKDRDDDWSSKFEGVDEEEEGLSGFSTADIFAELKRRGYDVQEA